MRNADEHLFNVVLFVAVFAFFGWLLTSVALPHEWYPRECCSGEDCAEITSAVELPNGEIRVTSKHGTTVIPKSFPRKPSADNKEHVCMRQFHEGDGWHNSTPSPPSGLMVPICYFVPMGS